MAELREISEQIVERLNPPKPPVFFINNTPRVELDIIGWYRQRPIIQSITVDGVKVLSCY